MPPNPHGRSHGASVGRKVPGSTVRRTEDPGLHTHARRESIIAAPQRAMRTLAGEHVMSTMNKAIIVGRLGKNPEVRTTSSGKAVANLSVATDRIGNKETREKITDWHRVSVFGQQAEFIGKYAAKGDTVLAEGAIVTNTYTDRNGAEQRSTEILAVSVRLIGRIQKREDEGAGYAPPRMSEESGKGGAGMFGMDDDIPF